MGNQAVIRATKFRGLVAWHLSQGQLEFFFNFKHCDSLIYQHYLVRHPYLCHTMTIIGLSIT